MFHVSGFKGRVFVTVRLLGCVQALKQRRTETSPAVGAGVRPFQRQHTELMGRALFAEGALLTQQDFVQRTDAHVRELKRQVISMEN